MKSHLLAYAESVGLRISEEYVSNEVFLPAEPWGCEGEIYPSLTGIALLNLYHVTGKEIYLLGVKNIINWNVKNQKPSGGWPLSLGARGNGVKFHVTEDIIRITSEIEDLPPTVNAIRLLSEYQQRTGDLSYSDSLAKGVQFLKKYWNAADGVFDEMLTGEALKLRASPRDYHIYAYQCIVSLANIYPEVEKYAAPLYESIKQNFEAMTPDTYPLLYGMHAALISQVEGASEYVVFVVRARLKEEIATESRFLIPNVPGALGHRDGLRGISLDEGHSRNSIGAALAMRYYDKFVGGSEFTESALYLELENWIQSMYDDGKYYEYIDLKTGHKCGDGSAAYFLPLFWILESF